MKKNIFCSFFLLPVVLISGCAGTLFSYEETPFYERAYALPAEAAEWAKTAPLADLCQGTKNWRHSHIREASLREIKERDLNTKACYYTGMELTP